MNIGKDARHPQYVCDKCGQTISYKHRMGYPVNKYYKQASKSYSIYKDFDLCVACEKKLRKWLKEREIPTSQDIIENFPKFEEVK